MRPPLPRCVIGHVFGEPVACTQLGDYLESVRETGAGALLEVPSLPATAGAGGARQGCLHLGSAPGGDCPAGPARVLLTWAAKSLLGDCVIRADARRLGIGEKASLGTWADALESSGDIPPCHVDQGEIASCYSSNRHRYEVPEGRLATCWALATSDAGAPAPATGGPGSRGEHLGWVQRGQLAGPLEEAIFEAPPGVVVGPVESQLGVHLVLVEALRPASVRPLGECAGEIHDELVGHRRSQLVSAWMRRRLAEAVSVEDGWEHPLDPGSRGAFHRH